MSASAKRARDGSEDSASGASGGDASENEDRDAVVPEEDAEGRAAAAKQRRMATNRRTAHSSRIRKKQLVASLQQTATEVTRQNEEVRATSVHAGCYSS